MTDLIGDHISRAGLLPWLVEVLEHRQRELRGQGDNTQAAVLARVTTSAALVSLVRELKRRSPSTGDYLRPTIPALFWRDLPFRRKLREDAQHRQALPLFEWAARNEEAARAVCIIDVLLGLAEMATQPDERAVAKVAERARAAVKEWQTAEALRAFGLPDDAAGHMQLASMYLCHAHILAREWAPDRDELLRAICRRLARLFGFRGYRIAAALVSMVLGLDVPISRRHTSYVLTNL